MKRLGADVEQLDAAEVAVRNAAETLRVLASQLTNQVSGTWWQGPGADAFRTAWQQTHGAALQQAAAFLLAPADEIRRNLREQRAKSGSGSGSGLAGSTAVGSAGVAGVVGSIGLTAAAGRSNLKSPSVGAGGTVGVGAFGRSAVLRGPGVPTPLTGADINGLAKAFMATGRFDQLTAQQASMLATIAASPDASRAFLAALGPNAATVLDGALRANGSMMSAYGAPPSAEFMSLSKIAWAGRDKLPGGFASLVVNLRPADGANVLAAAGMSGKDYVDNSLKLWQRPLQETPFDNRAKLTLLNGMQTASPADIRRFLTEASKQEAFGTQSSTMMSADATWTGIDKLLADGSGRQVSAVSALLVKAIGPGQPSAASGEVLREISAWMLDNPESAEAKQLRSDLGTALVSRTNELTSSAAPKGWNWVIEQTGYDKAVTQRRALLGYLQQDAAISRQLHATAQTNFDAVLARAVASPSAASYEALKSANQTLSELGATRIDALTSGAESQVLAQDARDGAINAWSGRVLGVVAAPGGPIVNIGITEVLAKRFPGGDPTKILDAVKEAQALFLYETEGRAVRAALQMGGRIDEAKVSPTSAVADWITWPSTAPAGAAELFQKLVGGGPTRTLEPSSLRDWSTISPNK